MGLVDHKWQNEQAHLPWRRARGSRSLVPNHFNDERQATQPPSTPLKPPEKGLKHPQKGQ